ncbi:MAG: response regulator [Pseudomonadota bacterium]
MAKILVTEDDEAVRSFIVRALQLSGHQVSEAEDGEMGFDTLCAADGEFDLLLTDIKMPIMDGITLAKSASTFFPALKILMMTGYADQRENARDLSRIVIDVVSKPFSLGQIRDSVEVALAA